jgi:hypothetical protein
MSTTDTTFSQTRLAYCAHTTSPQGHSIDNENHNIANDDNGGGDSSKDHDDIGDGENDDNDE